MADDNRAFRPTFWAWPWAGAGRDRGPATKAAAAEESATAAHARSSVQGETPRHLRRFFSLMLTEIWIGVPSKPNSSRRER